MGALFLFISLHIRVNNAGQLCDKYRVGSSVNSSEKITVLNDLKAVTKNLVRLAKKEGSEDNISIIVVFLKDPRDIVADNCPPMDLGLDNAVVNVPPFAVENEACKMVVAEAGGGECAEGGDNGVSDSDSDDLGPETAVDADLDIDDDAEMDNNDPAPPTPPAHAVGDSHVDGNLVDNVAESGEESEDEWNYYKVEGEQEQNPSEEVDEPPRSETPCQDNSAWESSSVDMNSSPLNPDAPVFVPGGVAGSDVLLAESPRKPLPMDDIELPDVAQFQTEAIVRPAELQDLDNCDQLNGHHNISMDGVTQHLNGNEKCEMESLGFGFSVGIEQDKIKDTSLFQDFERIQKDTTDFCNVQVFPAHTETNPFNIDGDDELFERLKNKENDPMSMSFYQEKDDDTCERFGKIESHVDLNAVQPLPDSDDEDIQPNGVCGNVNENKENICPDETSNLLGLEQGQEPNNDIIRFDDRSEIVGNNVPSLDNYMDFNIQNTNNMQNYTNTDFECNITREPVVQTDTPESHKLLFEQIPEIPDGKSSELGFTNEDLLDPSDSDKDGRVITPQDETSQDIEMEGKFDESPSEEVQQEIENVESEKMEENEIIIETTLSSETSEKLACENIGSAQETKLDDKPSSPEMAEENVIVEVHETPTTKHKEANPDIKKDDSIIANSEEDSELPEIAVDAPEIPYEEEKDSELQKLETEFEADSPSKSPVPSDSLINSESLLPKESPLPQESLLPGDSSSPQESPLPQEISLPRESPLSQEALLLRNSPISSDLPLPQDNLKPVESPLPPESPIPSESLLSQEIMHARESPLPQDMQSQESTLPEETSLLRDSPMLHETLVSQESSIPPESPLPKDSLIRSESPLSATSLAPVELVEHSSSSLSKSPHPSEIENLEATSPIPSPLPSYTAVESHSPVPSHNSFEPVPAEVPLPRESPVPADVTVPQENIDINKVNETPQGELLSVSHLPNESMTPVEQTLPVEIRQTSPLPTNFEQESTLEETQNKVFVTAENQEPKYTERESPNPLIQHCVSPMPVQSTENTESLILTEEPQSTSVPMESSHTELESKPSIESPVAEAPALESIHIKCDTAIISPTPVDEIKETTPSPVPVSESVEAKEITEVQKQVSEVSAPAPDIVPEERPRTELVTDIDIGIPESRAQEICVPVTNVIQHDDVVQPGATPPPTPAIEPAQPPALGEAPIAAATAAVAAAAAVTAAAATAAKTKSTGSPKKSPTTPTAKAAAPKTALKTTPSTRTPASATKRVAPASTATTPRTPNAAAPRAAAAARTPASAPKASPAARPAAKSAPSPATKPAPKPAAASESTRDEVDHSGTGETGYGDVETRSGPCFSPRRSPCPSDAPAFYHRPCN
ncbi:flocculation protein FLO11-like [Melitaea cinxia]|uniref:flocculation protein FLO11-like n=1 Tax=Melitaea cinxia TaxID=113334 RepID=UPI001E274B63|nr:flocculation protein FLO11-like [Melitaea cinxia]